MPEISIIVPVYKVEKYLHRCVDSILNQTFADFELILVDDGSPDSCGAICDEYARKDSRIRVVHKLNGGLSSARNAGMDVAVGEYIMFCDSDDYVSQIWCELMISCIREHPDAFIVSNLCKVTDGVETPYQLASEGIEKTDYFSIYKKGISAYAVNKIYRLATLRENRLRFDETCTFAEDVGFNAQYCALCGECYYVGVPLYYYVQNTSSIMYTYRADMYEMNIPLFWYRVPLIAEEDLGEYCDIWVHYFQMLFGCVFDPRNKMSFAQKMRYNQRMLQSEEVQWCLRHADGKTENPQILRILKTKNYYLYWAFTNLAKLKKKVLKKE